MVRTYFGINENTKSSIDNSEGGCNSSLRKICLGKTLRRTRVKAKEQTLVCNSFHSRGVRA